MNKTVIKAVVALIAIIFMWGYSYGQAKEGKAGTTVATTEPPTGYLLEASGGDVGGSVGKMEESHDSPSYPVRGAGNASDVTVASDKRYYNADELAKGLLYDLVPLAPYFIAAQETYGIDAVFLAAIAAEESGWGRYQFRRNNIFGFENCDFDSVAQCIDYAASWLKTHYITPGGNYYEGVGVVDINKHYNGRDTWEEHVTDIMGQITTRIESEGD